MKCKSCNHLIIDSAKFCPNCGKKITTTDDENNVVGAMPTTIKKFKRTSYYHFTKHTLAGTIVVFMLMAAGVTNIVQRNNSDSQECKATEYHLKLLKDDSFCKLYGEYYDNEYKREYQRCSERWIPSETSKENKDLYEYLDYCRSIAKKYAEFMAEKRCGEEHYSFDSK